ncbi:MAG: hypothetical protein ACMG6S_29520, partial [Byssovorax sp.]
MAAIRPLSLSLSLSIALLGALALTRPSTALAQTRPRAAETKARSTVLLATLIAEGGALRAPTPADAELAELS